MIMKKKRIDDGDTRNAYMYIFMSIYIIIRIFVRNKFKHSISQEVTLSIYIDMKKHLKIIEHE